MEINYFKLFFYSYKLSMFSPNLQKFSCAGCGIKRIEQFAFFGLNQIQELILNSKDWW